MQILKQDRERKGRKRQSANKEIFERNDSSVRPRNFLDEKNRKEKESPELEAVQPEMRACMHEPHKRRR